MGLPASSFTVKSARQEPSPPSATGTSGELLAPTGAHRNKKPIAHRNRMDSTCRVSIVVSLPLRKHTPCEEWLQDAGKREVITKALPMPFHFHSLIVEWQAVMPTLQGIIPALTTDIGFAASNSKRKKWEGAPSMGTVISSANRLPTATLPEERSYT